MLDPKLKEKRVSGGAGSKTFSTDCFMLLDLCSKNNQHTLTDYQACIFQVTGTLSLEFVISR